MNRALSNLTQALCFILFWTAGPRAELLDRMAAIVNNEVITLSDIYWTIGYKRLSIPAEPEPRRQLLQQTLTQLIEQRLIAEDAAATPGINVTDDEVSMRLQAYQRQFENEAMFDSHLTQIGMTRDDLRQLIRKQLIVLKFVSLRFEPFVVILPDQIEGFYENEFLPRLGVPEEMAPPLEQVQEQIREILRVEMTTQDLDEWIRNARRRARIRVLLQDEEGG